MSERSLMCNINVVNRIRYFCHKFFTMDWGWLWPHWPPPGHAPCANPVAWLTFQKHTRPYMCYHAEFSRSALNNVGINTGEPPRLGELDRTPLQGMGGLADPKMYAPPWHVLLCQVWYFCDKRCTHKYKETPKMGSAWAQPLLVGHGWQP